VKTIKIAIAIIELLLVLPAALFMTELFVRNIQPSPYQPAESARRIVEWFSARPHFGLGVLLIALPFAAFVIGGTTVLRSWVNDAEFRRAILGAFAAVRAHLAKVLIAVTTLLAGGILAIVALHMITD
jgi:cytochrome b561